MEGSSSFREREIIGVVEGVVRIWVGGVVGVGVWREDGGGVG